MNALIGDIGNTVTKICVIEINTFKIRKTIYFNTTKIFLKTFLKKKLKNFLNKDMHNVALFSSVVPGCTSIFGSFLKKKYSIILREIKEKKLKKLLR